MKMKNILIIFDLQKQFIDKNGEYEKCLDFIKNNKDKYDKIIGTIFSQNDNNKHNPNYNKHMHWNGCLNCSEADLEYEIKSMKLITKTGYGSIQLVNFLLKNFDKTDKIEIVGCDIDACITAICFQLWDAGFEDFKILTQYCFSTVKLSKDTLVEILKRNFGDCVV